MTHFKGINKLALLITLAAGLNIACADSAMEKSVDKINSKLSKLFSSFHKGDHNASLFGKNGSGGYVRLFTSHKVLADKDLDPKIVSEVMKHGQYEISDPKVGQSTCKSRFYKSFKNDNYIIGYGRGCK